MFDIRLIRENLERVQSGLAAKRVDINLEAILQMDQQRRELVTNLDELRAQKNAANDEISQCIKNKQDPQEKIAAMKTISQQIAGLEPQVKEMDARLKELLIAIPNLPHDSVPVGGEDANTVVRSWGEPRSFDFKAKDHIELAETLDIIDFKRATKITGSNFILFKNDGARLERALINFMLDLHGREHGYKEMMPPVVVNRASMTGTGQLPKMEEDMYHIATEDLFLIPTAEVPITNIHRDEILAEENLPLYYTGFTPCFRREAGSYGKDTRGLMRVHQFDKVEMVKFVKPETSYDELESLVGNAEKVLQMLKLPYRVLMLASGDLSFAAAKCYDIEGFAPGIDKWLEISSCSNFEDFQARRSNIRYKGKDTPKSTFVHTLNGSGVAMARTVVAILENYQTPDGNVEIPEVLRPYMGGQTLIKKNGV
ncbi:MAG: serine--tRNA ligase [Candidatus Omnitrophica bacterium]|nr:serine--tRNA ligase [Candidatus Omnitrophota bacterium]